MKKYLTLIMFLFLFLACMGDPLIIDLSNIQLRITSVRKEDTEISNVDSSRDTLLIIEAKTNNGYVVDPQGRQVKFIKN